MRPNHLKVTVKTLSLGIIFLLCSTVASAQVTVSLTATRQTALTPDGTIVPMWGWFCSNNVMSGTTTTVAVPGGGTCSTLAGAVQTAGAAGAPGVVWQPPLITVPTGTGLSITLTNSLPAATSLTIVGQLGGGLGTPAREAAPRNDGAHAGQTQTTWTIQIPATFTPPAQGQRVRSFAPEATAGGGTQTYTWAAYNAATGTGLKPGTYLIETGTYPSIQGPMGLYGVLVVTTAPATGARTAYAGSVLTAAPSTMTAYQIQYDADVPLLLSEIDPVQNSAVEKVAEAQAGCAVNTGACTGTIPAAVETAKWNPTCAASTTVGSGCYPPAVDYTPLYFLMNGVSFDKTSTAPSTIGVPATTAATTGNVLLRFVNAGLRMHVPSVNELPMQLIAEDGNVLADVALQAARGGATSFNYNARTQNDVFLSAGKVYDVVVKPANAAGSYTAGSFTAFDRQLSLSGNGFEHDTGMQAVVLVSSTTGLISPSVTAAAVADNYIIPVGAATFTGNVLNNDIGIHNAAQGGTCSGTLSTASQTFTTTGGRSVLLNPNGSFTLTVGAALIGADTFTYCGNGVAALTATVTFQSAPVGAAPTATDDSFTSSISSLIKVNAPGVLANDTDPTGYPLSVVATLNSHQAGLFVTMATDGAFTARPATPCSTPAGCVYTFTYHDTNSQGTSSNVATVTLTFQAGSSLSVRVQDAQTKAQIQDYKWIIEQDLTFYVDPACQQTGPGGSKPATCPASAPVLGTNFHTSYMPVIADGCTGPQSCERGQSVYDPNSGSHLTAACDGSGNCTTGASQLPQSLPSQAHLPATDVNGRPARYYISVLTGDAANPFNTGNVTATCGLGNTPSIGTPGGGYSVSTCGHTMGGAPIPPPSATGFAPVTVNVEPNPMKTATLTVFVFEDDFPLNGEPDTGGGVDTNPTQEVPLGDFQVVLWDDAGASGDATGQMHHDMFNEPLTNSLNGTMDPVTGLNACPIANTASGIDTNGEPYKIAEGTIIVCPEFESDGKTPSPLTGQAVIRNLMPGRFGVTVHPGAAREARGEEWLQTNTLDGTHFLDSFVKSGEPAYFQEFGPGGYHVFMGMANPAIINARLAALCGGAGAPSCNGTVTGQVNNLHMSRPPNEQLFPSSVFAAGDAGNYAPFAHTTCYVSLGDSDGATLALAKCDDKGNFTFHGIPDGDYAIVVFDQWLDLIVDGSSKSLSVRNGAPVGGPVNYSAFTWQTHIWNKTYMDLGGPGGTPLGVPVLLPDGTLDPVKSPPLIQIPTRVRLRNGKFNNTLFTDIGGQANFNETFPLFNWYVVESDTTRFKGTGVHVVYDAGGSVDAPTTPTSSVITRGILNSQEPSAVQLPTTLRYPGSVYCPTADCSTTNLATNPTGGGAGGSTGRVDPGSVVAEGVQGFISQTQILDWGKLPYASGENGGIRGHTVYSSTRPFDDPSQLFQNLWEPLVPGVTMNLYQEVTLPDGTQSLKLIDTTQTTSWDAWAQGFRTAGVPNMNCPGQATTDPFFNLTLAGTTNYLNPTGTLPNNSQFKCYDGMHVFNQVQPAPYDGLYQFPSPTCRATPGATFSVTVNGTAKNIKCATVDNPAAASLGSAPAILPAGRYVVEAVTPPGYEPVKEEDKNILIGDNFIAPVTQQFGGLSNIWIVPDQASITAYNSCYGTGGGCTNPTTDMGHPNPSTFGPGGLITSTAPCVGALRIVPDFMSISPESGEVAPFAGASRHLCDRKEVTLEDQMQAQTDFFMWTKTPAATHFTGFILDDFSSEFDPASPTFGEKFAVPNMPVSIRDFNGTEISRVYSDQWGIYDGLIFSTWDVDPPNPTGYAPGMEITCMNDPGPIPGPGGIMITDPLYNPAYSNFCYENPFMPADTTYLDTPVVPVSAFAEAYNPPDCAYPDATPAIGEVDGDGIGPYVSAAGGRKLTIYTINGKNPPPGVTAGDQIVPNHAYTGPFATTAPFNQKFITRHYGFGTIAGTVTVGGVPLTGVSWTDTMITGTVPPSVPVCAHQQAGAGNGGARCGELVITAANGNRSIDTVTVTVGGKAPTRVNGENSAGNAIQHAIDVATSGDLIIVGPGTYNEMLLMWKPVRLQGVGAASTVVNANTHPSGKLLEPWRRQVNCLFGLALDGGFVSPTHPYDPNPTNPFMCATPPAANGQSQVDPIPLEPVVGWDASLNGNIAELLQEPTLMGAYEGAAITVLAKGLENNNTGTCNPTNSGGCIPLNASTAAGGDCNASSPFYASNFLCNPSRIDGMTFTNSSQGGGGIFLHGWNHFTEVSNNRVTGNGGTLTGGITVGQMETPDPTMVGTIAQPLMINHDVYVHHNSVTLNASFGDELNSNTPSSAGGVTFCTGSDNYKFQYNWICGNLSTGDGGGAAHNGFSWNGDIEHNWFLFNQSFNTTLTTYGGGLIVEGAPPDGAACENAGVDHDCPPALSDGAGPGTTVNANLFQGNTAESGSGGGFALEHINGNDVLNNPSNPGAWYGVTVTNNIVVDNVAGWTGGGFWMLDAAKVDFINNTVMSNDTTASAGVLFDTPGAPNGGNPAPGCNPNTGSGCTNPITTSNFQPSGLATERHSLNLQAAFTNSGVTCPAGHANCTAFSNPVLRNNIFWQNRAFHISTAANPIPGLQTVVTLVPVLSQSTTGACPATGFNGGPGPTYWDIGVYGDTAANNHSSGLTLSPIYSVLTDAADYPGANNLGSNPAVVSQYCNGSRVPPETASITCTSTSVAPGCSSNGRSTVPAGVPDINPFYPVYNLSPAATVDEGNNWINMFYGPLSTTNASIASGSAGYNVPLGNYALAAGSPAIDAVPVAQNHPRTDFFGNPRPDAGNAAAFDIGAVEFVVGGVASTANVTGGPLAFGNVVVGRTSASRTLTLNNTGTAALTGITVGITPPFARATAGGTCGAILAAASTCTINVVFQPTLLGAAAGSVTVMASVPVTGSPVALTGTGIAPVALAPGTWTPTATRGEGLLGPVQLFTLTNNLTVPLTSITQGTLSGANAADFLVVRLLSTCGPAGNGQLLGQTTLAVGGSCIVTVQFRPSTNEAAGIKNATLSVTDSAGTQTSTLIGTAN